MPAIKIVSNPYHKNISYYRLDADEWKEINYDNNKNSKLISDKLRTGFFPFIAEKVVGIIYDEYCDEDRKVDLIFEGSDDEYRDLEMVCLSPNYIDKITLSKSDHYLENARDILPEIVKVYEKIEPVILQTVPVTEKIRIALDKFTDAASDTIPIGVLGNYSSGKSTFINALIGRDILPSADNPLTARVYKLTDSHQEDRASISFKYEDKEIEIKLDDKNTRFIKGDPGIPIVKSLQEIFEENRNQRLELRVNKALLLINNYGRNNENQDENLEDPVSNLVEIVIPFRGEVWGRTPNNFVIFDTPGSNSNSNDNHFAVLEKALDDMSNGLPIYVADFDSLDSTDNEKLNALINSIEELDGRFTMIIVNKADAADLPRDGFTEADKARILNLAVPRNMYADGIYYVSSIMGIGAKNDGDFLNDHYAEIYEDLYNKYSNPKSRYYKQLYKYNITAEQLKQKMVASAEKYHNLVLANSGLQSVENEILTFACKYAYYNKCQQALLFLGKVIDDTSKEIRKAKDDKEKSRHIKIEHLEKEKQELIEKIREKGDHLETGFLAEYEQSMASIVDEEEIQQYSYDDLYAFQNEMIKKRESEMGYEEKVADVQDSLQNLTKNLFSNVQQAFKSKGIDSFKKITEEAVTDIKEIQSSSGDRRKTKSEINKAAADDLINKLKEDYKKHGLDTKSRIDTASKYYWREKSNRAKIDLLSIVTDASVLSDDKKYELSTLILSYEKIDFESHAEEVFVKENFEYRINLGFFGFGIADRLNLDKLSDKYNQEITESVEQIYEVIKQNHNEIYKNWIQDLVEKVIDNIIELNPSLTNQAKYIQQDTDRITELKHRQIELNAYEAQIRSMMGWKEA